ncbi:MAG: hypothetical protein JW818_17510 [Pirellulales bacterium]|nr:hypothetical protein [Pirellulales bacterium]
MAARRKEEIVTFKVDHALWEAMQGIPNRSAFIRSAILTALDSVCPLCQGSGTLTPDQRNHWERFARHHTIERCDDCDAFHLVCVGREQEEHGEEERGE